MFVVQGRIFTLRDDKTFNVKGLHLPIGSSLYDVKNRYNGNVFVHEGAKYIYTIRYLFEKGTIITKVQKETDGDAKITISTHKNNPFIKFCTEYRDTHQGEKK